MLNQTTTAETAVEFVSNVTTEEVVEAGINVTVQSINPSGKVRLLYHYAVLL